MKKILKEEKREKERGKKIKNKRKDSEGVKRFDGKAHKSKDGEVTKGGKGKKRKRKRKL